MNCKKKKEKKKKKHCKRKLEPIQQQQRKNQAADKRRENDFPHFSTFTNANMLLYAGKSKLQNGINSPL